MKCLLRPKYLMLVLLLIFSARSYAQQEKMIHIYGKLSDSTGKTALAYSSVYLLSADSSVKLTKLTDQDGIFFFRRLPVSGYKLTATSQGYADTTITIDKADLERSKDTFFVSLRLPLTPAALQEVILTSSKKIIERTIDKVIVNVTRSPVLTTSINSFDLMQKLPGVMLQDDIVMLQGKPVDIRVDGRPLNLYGAELRTYLNSIPGSQVEKVELIANPTSAFDANAGAIINIILVKIKRYGLNGSFLTNAMQGVYPRINTGVNLNYRNKKVNIYGSGYLEYSRERNRIISSWPGVFGTQVNLLENRQLELNRNINIPLKAGLDVDFSKNTFASLVVNFLSGDNKNTNSNNTYIGPSGITGPDSTIVLQSVGKTRSINPSVNLYLKTKLDTLGSQLSFNIDYWNYDRRISNELSSYFYDNLNQPYKNPAALRNNLPAVNNIASSNFDLTLPKKKYSLSFGGKFYITKRDNNFQWENYLSGTWVADALRSNYFVYKETNAALYAGFKKSIKKLEVQVIARAEKTRVTGISKTLNAVNTQDYLKLFPSLNLGYSISDNDYMGFSYRKSIARPSFSNIDPFALFLSEYSLLKGNPNLQPQISHSYSFTYSYREEITTTVNYLRMNNGFSKVFLKDPVTNVVTTSFDNLSRYDGYGLDVNYFKRLFKKINTVTNVNLSYADVNTVFLDSTVKNSGFGFLISSFNSFQVGKKINGNVFFAYSSPYRGTLFNYKSSAFVNIGMGFPVLNSNGYVNISVSDIFKTTRFAYSSTFPGLGLQYQKLPDSRYISVVFSYRFGSQNIAANKNRETGIEREKNRMKTTEQ
ncbi:MAG: TonB-dependent receptor [Chitinophagaceae bacterium]|nr:TonB-dependent receptor [Chitinophagaceae bacterium]